ncbi:cytochrome c oxidase subunit 6A2, mitochondrial [Neodiprion pinetum]|uniref:Cytochrome c oxidase subunit n=1 Tax=Neodiprion lecontei TaxID=441921 RepID=A0A6J0BFK3_NEOLC|nr:cytochrome c oxidase subunit 6A2, mitochondrial [Neodiprion lecontei]XP_046427822.1 cytochrome c oxidase subunit 6A2, mitochondrial-like [Neodiprion fabricii]XP_046481203.1 cytochrome c oxidase subunit 6A2, mitochondrial-like [Neodiprion pinetum]XP_046621870.1 cytochrome c oxidase subunit 6A2, mitochondrial-like [Neodiprion virginianus]
MAASRVVIASLRKYSTGHNFTGGSAVTGHGPETVKLWKNISYFVAFPSIIVCSIYNYLKHQEAHNQPRPEFVPYEYLCIRNKPFPWGDGNHSFFHNPHKNALPTGYEDEH